MIYSMTGYGKASTIFQGYNVTVEFRSLNSKNFDFIFKAPPALRDKEAEVRQRAVQILERGKVDCWVSLEANAHASGQIINEALVGHYLQQLKKMAEQHGLPQSDFLSMAMRMPDVVQNAEQSLNDEAWEPIAQAIAVAVDALLAHRRAEGISIANTFFELVQGIESKLLQIEPLEAERKVKTRERLKKAFLDAGLEGSVDQNRFEQELIYYLEKLDISEEKVRLANHCQYFKETMNSPEPSGKKLNFIAQEMGREINTLGAKANQACMQRLVVEMKDDLEKIKEQVLNTL